MDVLLQRNQLLPYIWITVNLYTLHFHDWGIQNLIQYSFLSFTFYLLEIYKTQQKYKKKTYNSLFSKDNKKTNIYWLPWNCHCNSWFHTQLNILCWFHEKRFLEKYSLILLPSCDVLRLVRPSIWSLIWQVYNIIPSKYISLS